MSDLIVGVYNWDDVVFKQIDVIKLNVMSRVMFYTGPKRAKKDD